jgi:hypothetical protein
VIPEASEPGQSAEEAVDASQSVKEKFMPRNPGLQVRGRNHEAHGAYLLQLEPRGEATLEVTNPWVLNLNLDLTHLDLRGTTAAPKCLFPPESQAVVEDFNKAKPRA